MSRNWFTLGFLLTTGIARELLPRREIGVGDNNGHRVLESKILDMFVVDRVVLWIDPPYVVQRPCEKKVTYSLRRVNFNPKTPVELCK